MDNCLKPVAMSEDFADSAYNIFQLLTQEEVYVAASSLVIKSRGCLQ